MAKRNTASRAPTAGYINLRGQGLADRNFDAGINYKSAQIGPHSFIAWNFNLVDIDECQDEDDFSNLRMGTLFCSAL